jgi:hypothetical protein
MHGLKNQIFTLRLRVLYVFAIQDRVINTRNYKKHIMRFAIIISSCTVLAQSEYKKRHDIFAPLL